MGCSNLKPPPEALNRQMVGPTANPSLQGNPLKIAIDRLKGPEELRQIAIPLGMGEDSSIKIMISFAVILLLISICMRGGLNNHLNLNIELI
jgi:hypothetical protein